MSCTIYLALRIKIPKNLSLEFHEQVLHPTTLRSHTWTRAFSLWVSAGSASPTRPRTSTPGRWSPRSRAGEKYLVSQDTVFRIHRSLRVSIINSHYNPKYPFPQNYVRPKTSSVYLACNIFGMECPVGII